MPLFPDKILDVVAGVATGDQRPELLYLYARRGDPHLVEAKSPAGVWEAGPARVLKHIAGELRSADRLLTPPGFTASLVLYETWQLHSARGGPIRHDDFRCAAAVDIAGVLYEVRVNHDDRSQVVRRMHHPAFGSPPPELRSRILELLAEITDAVKAANA